jgi:predicted CXXCH cytochrome family protein
MLGATRTGRASWWTAATLAAGYGCLVLCVNSCSTGDRAADMALVVPGAHEVGNKACLDCHGDIVRRFPGSPHARVHLASLKDGGGTGCESCHGPGSKHIEAGGGRKFIINPGKDPAACLQCHLQVRSDFASLHHHPVLEGRMNCIQCHDPHGDDIFKPSRGGLAMARLNESCAQCHRAQTRAVVFEHPAMREGCVTCHNPHGSLNRKMLTQSDPNLCLRCHAQVAGPAASGAQVYIGNINHTSFLKMGTCWAAGCHTAIHGSSVDVFLRF